MSGGKERGKKGGNKVVEKRSEVQRKGGMRENQGEKEIENRPD